MEQTGLSTVGSTGKEGSIFPGPEGIMVFHTNGERELTK